MVVLMLSFTDGRQLQQRDIIHSKDREGERARRHSVGSRNERGGVGGRGRAQTEAPSERSCLNIRPPCHIISTLSAAGGQPGTDVRSPRGGPFRAIEP